MFQIVRVFLPSTSGDREALSPPPLGCRHREWPRDCTGDCSQGEGHSAAVPQEAGKGRQVWIG